MKRWIDYGLCAVLALGGAGHLAGTFLGYAPGTEVFAWSLGASALVFTIVFLHVLRIRRAGDAAIAWGAIVATLAWIVVAVLFGQAIGDVADPRVLMHVLASAGLVVTAMMGLSSPSAVARNA